MKANALQLFEVVDRRVPLPFGAVRNRRSLLFSGNFVAATMATLQSGDASRVFFVSDGQDVSTPELIRAVGAALGQPARLVAVPVPLLTSLARAGDLMARFGRFPWTSGTLDRLVGSLVVDSSALRSLTGYAPVSLEEGLAVTAQWYRHAGRRT
jgi:nucleoside-diphosphate-sugar epimerase